MKFNFQKNQRVKITNPGHIYTTYDDKFIELGFKNTIENNTLGVDIKDEFVVFGRTNHSPNYDLEVVAIRNSKGDELLIGHKGIVLVGPKYPRTHKRFDPENWDWYSFFRMRDSSKEKYAEKADNLAQSWVTCACGQLCSVLPKKCYGGEEPADSKLSKLGNDFAIHIEKKRWSIAKEILNQIEARTNYLLGCKNYKDPNA